MIENSLLLLVILNTRTHTLTLKALGHDISKQFVT